MKIRVCSTLHTVDIMLIDRSQILYSHEIQKQAKLMCFDKVTDSSYLFGECFVLRGHEGDFLGPRKVLYHD